MSSINVGKGMFRLWAILAVGWIIFCIRLIVLHRSLDFESLYVVLREGGPMVILEGGPFIPHFLPKYNWDEVAEFMLLPPALILVLGLASAWVLRGFRTSKT